MVQSAFRNLYVGFGAMHHLSVASPVPPTYSACYSLARQGLIAVKRLVTLRIKMLDTILR